MKVASKSQEPKIGEKCFTCKETFKWLDSFLQDEIVCGCGNPENRTFASPIPSFEYFPAKSVRLFKQLSRVIAKQRIITSRIEKMEKIHKMLEKWHMGHLSNDDEEKFWKEIETLSL